MKLNLLCAEDEKIAVYNINGSMFVGSLFR